MNQNGMADGRHMLRADGVSKRRLHDRWKKTSAYPLLARSANPVLAYPGKNPTCRVTFCAISVSFGSISIPGALSAAGALGPTGRSRGKGRP
jgi:hypothetical protein